MSDRPGVSRGRPILSIICFAIVAVVIRACQQEQWKTQREGTQPLGHAKPRSPEKIIVFFPGPNGDMWSRSDVEIIDKGVGFVKFRMEDGQVIEHHGTYRIETRKRD